MSELMIPEELQKEITTLEEMTKSVVVRNSDERALVFQAVQTAKAKKKSIVDFFADMKEKAFRAHRAISQAERAETDRLDAFERAGKAAINAYDAKVEAARQAEQRRLQAIADEQARKEREKQEAEARRQRQIEQEARDKAEAARLAAEQASGAERAKLIAEAEAADRKAAAASVKAEAKEENAVAVIAPVVQIAQAVEKQKGESAKTIFKMKIVNFALLPDEYKLPNQSALDTIARATKGAIKIPGCEVYSEQSISIRTAV